MRLQWIADGEPIPGSYWGESEAGLQKDTLFVRRDTPVHSALHELCHWLCMDPSRRQRLQTDAGGEDIEEAGVCYLQALLAETVPGYSQARLFADMADLIVLLVKLFVDDSEYHDARDAETSIRAAYNRARDESAEGPEGRDCVRHELAEDNKRLRAAGYHATQIEVARRLQQLDRLAIRTVRAVKRREFRDRLGDWCSAWFDGLLQAAGAARNQNPARTAGAEGARHRHNGHAQPRPEG